MERARAPIQSKPRENKVLNTLIYHYGDKSQHSKYAKYAIHPQPQRHTISKTKEVEFWRSNLDERYEHMGRIGSEHNSGLLNLKRQESLGRIRDAFIGVAKEHFSPEALTEMQTNGIAYERHDRKVLAEMRTVQAPDNYERWFELADKAS